MQLFTYEIMSEIICLTHANDCDVYSVCLDRRVCTQVLQLREAGTNHNTLFCHAI